MPKIIDHPMVVTKPEQQADQAQIAPLTCWLYGRNQISEYLGVSTRVVTSWVQSKRLTVKWINDRYYMAKPETLDVDIENMAALYEHHRLEKIKADNRKKFQPVEEQKTTNEKGKY